MLESTGRNYTYLDALKLTKSNTRAVALFSKGTGTLPEMMIALVRVSDGYIERAIVDTLSATKPVLFTGANILTDEASEYQAYFALEIMNKWGFLSISLDPTLSSPVSPSFYILST